MDPHGTDAPAPTAGVDAAGLARRVAEAVGRTVSGNQAAIEASITTLLAGGHLLLEDVPGVGKTTLAKALAGAMSADVKRVQFTSDMLPTDVTGLSIYDRDAHEFAFHPGPVFTHMLIGDEINRATPKTQSALLEAMGEHSVTVDGRTHALPELFTVVATQNPHDMEGTFPLPEAQRDRFMTRISLGYPDAGSEAAMITRPDDRAAHAAVATVDEMVAARRQAARTRLAPEVAEYLVALITATRAHDGLTLGASPRAGLHLAAMAKAHAATQGRDYVSPDDIARLADTVLTHRLVPRGHHATATAAHRASAAIVADIVARTPAP